MRESVSEGGLNPVQLRLGKAAVFPKLRRPVWAVEVEHRFAAIAYHMNMGRAVIVWIDDHPEPTNPVDSWHYRKPKRFGCFSHRTSKSSK
jgi:hypothetical protein